MKKINALGEEIKANWQKLTPDMRASLTKKHADFLRYVLNHELFKDE